MIGIIYFIFALGIIILVHELGHLVMAKRNGVHCHEFSIGMGPKLKHVYTDSDGTIYSIRWIPIGGYVMMAGEDSGNEKDEEIPDENKLDNKKPWAKTKILVAGSFMNIVLAVFIFLIIGFFGGVANNNSTKVEVIDGMPASEAGVETGDTIVSVDGVVVDDQNELFYELGESSEVVTLEYIDSSNELNEVDVVKDDDGLLGVTAYKERFRPIKSIIYGLVSTVALIISIFVSFTLLLTDQYGASDLAGPIGIYAISSEVLTHGIEVALLWIAFLSVNIGIINMLPIPALDGGRMLFVIYEAITKKKASKKIEHAFIMVGVILLLGLLVFVTINDIIRIITM